MSDTHSNIQNLVDNNPVVLFMKGNRNFPQCGFSATVVQILDELLPEYETINVLADPEIRTGIKSFSNWPTIPQLYIRGEFVGGCDIIKEMYSDGGLQDMLGVEEAEEVDPPNITITAAAIEAIQGVAADQEEGDLRLNISSRFEYGLDLTKAGAKDVIIETNGVRVVMDRGSARRAEGTIIDFEETSTGAGFVISNPNEPASVQQVTPEQLQALMAGNDELMLLDVRTDDEREICTIPGALPFTQELEKKIMDLDRSTGLAFHCHSGGRSQQAAEHFLAQGFTSVFNLAGGIGAWADDIDPDMKRY
ncbi:MAG TPA: Grx4 family monothiol glutaredoxin [Myxococcales bacterium]|nr:Grx4 family monothiol glutaredoxin [Myxococcales bacterium]HIN85636.1 Grx4 family monothiol glutaredoxin [Myxococcales bacterium]